MSTDLKQPREHIAEPAEPSDGPARKTGAFNRLISVRAAPALTARLAVTRGRLRTAMGLLLKRPIQIRLFGDAYCFDTYRVFTARHPKFPLFRRKSLGVALRDLDIPPEEVFGGPKFAYFRRRLRRAERLGYRVAPIDPSRYLDQIMRIHGSSAVRQKKAIRSDYLDKQKVAAYHQQPGPWYGVFDKQGTLRAYCHLPVIGDCCFYSRILGDAQKLEDGIIYHLVHDTIREMRRLRDEKGYPRWIMYDMFLGGQEGLREFKRRAGFHPERVAWIWEGFMQDGNGNSRSKQLRNQTESAHGL